MIFSLENLVCLTTHADLTLNSSMLVEGEYQMIKICPNDECSPILVVGPPISQHGSHPSISLYLFPPRKHTSHGERILLWGGPHHPLLSSRFSPSSYVGAFVHLKIASGAPQPTLPRLLSKNYQNWSKFIFHLATLLSGNITVLPAKMLCVPKQL